MLVDSFSNDLKDILENAMAKNSPVLLSMDFEYQNNQKSSKNRNLLTKILQEKNKANSKVKDFQLYLVVTQSIREVLTPRGLSLLTASFRNLGLSKVLSGNLVDMELIREALESHLLRIVTNYDRPEHQIRYKSVVTDLILHQQKLDEKEEEMLNATLDSRHRSLLHAKDLLKVLKEKEEFEVSALDQIKETRKNLEQFDKQLKMYQPLTKFAGAVLCSLHRFSSVFHYFSFRITEFEEILAELIVRFKTTKPSNNAASINAYVLYLKNCLMLSLYKHFQVYMVFQCYVEKIIEYYNLPYDNMYRYESLKGTNYSFHCSLNSPWKVNRAMWMKKRWGCCA